MRIIGIALVIPLLLLVSVACGGNSAESVNSPSAGPGDPTIEIISPGEGETVSGEAIEIEIEVTNFVQDGGAIGNAMVPGRGHWHLLLDNGFMYLDVGERATLENVPPGVHTVKIFLVNNDHTPLKPPVEDSVLINVR